MIAEIDPSLIADEGARQAVVWLLNLVEQLHEENVRLRAENQALRDEINRLKGEQGKPEFKTGKRKVETGEKTAAIGTAHSSEEERDQAKEWAKGKKKEKLTIHHTQVLQVAVSELPADAEFKGYEEVVVQDVKVTADNVLFRKEKFYSRSQQRSYLAPLPAGYEGQFGPGVRALVIMMYYVCQVTEPKLHELLQTMGLAISEGQISAMLIHKQEVFAAEKTEMYAAGLRSSPYQQTDSTGMRENGETRYCHMVGNALYTVYTTMAGKDRRSVLQVLCNKEALGYRFDEAAWASLDEAGLSAVKRTALRPLQSDVVWEEAAFRQRVEQAGIELGPQQWRLVLESAAFAAYRKQALWPVVHLLLSDDATVYQRLVMLHALCWVHEGRHYTKLLPHLPQHQQALQAFGLNFGLTIASSWPIPKSLPQKPRPNYSRTSTSSSAAKPIILP